MIDKCAIAASIHIILSQNQIFPYNISALLICIHFMRCILAVPGVTQKSQLLPYNSSAIRQIYCEIRIKIHPGSIRMIKLFFIAEGNPVMPQCICNQRLGF